MHSLKADAEPGHTGKMPVPHRPATTDCPQPGADCGTPTIVDMGAYEYQPPARTDMNQDTRQDGADIQAFVDLLLPPP